MTEPLVVRAAGAGPATGGARWLHRLVGEHVDVGVVPGANAHLEVPALVAGMNAGADSIDDTALLRYAPWAGCSRSAGAITLGTFLRSFTFGHVRQLDAIASRLPAAAAVTAQDEASVSAISMPSPPSSSASTSPTSGCPLR